MEKSIMSGTSASVSSKVGYQGAVPHCYLDTKCVEEVEVSPRSPNHSATAA